MYKISDHKEKKINKCLNCFKAIGCFGVVFIHVPFPGLLGNLLKTLAAFTVPLFFIISGFYAFYQDAETGKIKALQKSARITKMTLPVIAIYFIYTILVDIFFKDTMSLILWIKSNITLNNFVRIIFLNDYDVISAGHLWFLGALIYCYLILYLLYRFNLFKMILPIIVVIFLIRIFFLGKVDDWHYRGNVIVSGLPYFMLGYLFAKTKIYQEFACNIFLLLILTGGAFSIFDIFIKFPIDLFYIGIICMSCSMFIYAQLKPESINIKSLTSIGSKYSFFIYCMHIIIASIINKLFYFTGAAGKKWGLYILPIAVILVTLCCAVVFYGVKDILQKRLIKS